MLTCPADQPFSTFNEGHCQATCPDGDCNGIVCPADEPYVVAVGSGDERPLDLECRSTCEGFLLGRECVARCPENLRVLRGSQKCVTVENCASSDGSDTLSRCDAVCEDPTPFLDRGHCAESCPEFLPFFTEDSAGRLICVAECPSDQIPNEETNACEDRPEPPH